VVAEPVEARLVQVVEALAALGVVVQDKALLVPEQMELLILVAVAVVVVKTTEEQVPLAVQV
jgi:hypothetical protein